MSCWPATIMRMGERRNIVIGGKSALHLYLHSDGPESIGATHSRSNPLKECAGTVRQLTAFNTQNPLYGGEPVTLLVPDKRSRRASSLISSRCLTCEVPDGSFYELRDGLYVASPELTFALLGRGRPLGEVAEAGLNLCARYFIHYQSEIIFNRSKALVTPRQLQRYLEAVHSMRGAGTSAEALRWVAPNSGSPMESKAWLQFRLPRRHGGFNLPFDGMNLDVRAGRLAGLTTQRDFSIDMVCTKYRFGLEYDGQNYHEDASHDKRRRNELASLGWTVMPIERDTLFNAEETERVAHQIARQLKVRLQNPPRWEARYAQLRESLGLPL